MSDLKDRVGVLTGGNADLIKNPGDLITGDGSQTVYLRNPNVGGASDGLVLTLDSTVEEGMSWQAGGGGGGGITNVTGADGITVTTPSGGVRQVHNSLVTGNAVAGVNMQTGGNMVAVVDGDIQIDNNSSGAELLMSAAGEVKVSQGSQKFEITSAGVVNVAGSVAVNVQAGTDLTLGSTAGDVNVNADVGCTVTTGGLFQADVGGSAGIAAQDNVLISAGNNGTTGLLTIQNNGVGSGPACNIVIEQTGAGDIRLNTGSGSAIATLNGSFEVSAIGDKIEFVASTFVSIQPANGNFKIFGGNGAAQHAPIADATGGAVIDAEARTALNALLAAMRDTGWGFIAT